MTRPDREQEQMTDVDRSTTIQEAEHVLGWLAQLAENARVQDEPAAAYNPRGDSKPLRTAAERADRLVRSLLSCLRQQEERIAEARQEGIGVGRLSGDVLVAEMRARESASQHQQESQILALD